MRKRLSNLWARFKRMFRSYRAKEAISAAFRRYQERWPEAGLKLIDLERIKKSCFEGMSLRICFEVFGNIPGQFIMSVNCISPYSVFYELTNHVAGLVDSYQKECEIFDRIKEKVAAIRSEEALAEILKEVKK